MSFVEEKRRSADSKLLVCNFLAFFAAIAGVGLLGQLDARELLLIRSFTGIAFCSA